MGGIDVDAIATGTRISSSALRYVWDSAAEFDDSIKLKSKWLSALASKQIRPVAFSRSALFRRMSLWQSSLFCGLRIRPRLSDSADQRFSPLDEFRSGLPRTTLARVRTRNSKHFVPLSNVLDRWLHSDSVFGVTDLHYIRTRFDKRIDTTGLNDFNLLPRGTDGHQSQDSLVISTSGAFTDSHSDDHCGSNHCFVGSKLWLLWDTVEGFDHGLEDVERCLIYDRAAFDLSVFLAMKSSRWILIGPNQTMFIPAHLTHKVITLQPYLGLGSFHAGLPGFVDLLMRWTRLPPVWALRSKNPCSVEFITRRAIRKIETLRKATRHQRFHWGVPHLRARLRHSDTTNDVIDRHFRQGDTSSLKDFLHAARRLETD
jgi:hypothetical protein